MTEQETREKIVEIMDRVWYQPVPCTIERKHEAIVDAFIESGLRFGESYSHTATFNMAQLDRINELERRLGEAEHRAEVAERALRNMARNYWEVEGRCLGAYNWESCKNCKKHILAYEKEAVDCLVKVHLEQAEKESKEKGNEQD